MNRHLFLLIALLLSPLLLAGAVQAAGPPGPAAALRAFLETHPAPFPDGAYLASLETVSTTFTVRLVLPAPALTALSPAAVEGMTEQIARTLEPFHWRDLRVAAFDPTAGRFRPLAAFLPATAPPRKEGLPAPPAAPLTATGSLAGKTVYVSAGHGWEWNTPVNGWRTQRPPYPLPPYPGPIIEDHNNAEAVNQYLIPYLRQAGARVIPVREGDMNPLQAVVPLTSTNCVTAGRWLPGDGYLWTTTVTTAPTAAITWTALIPADGDYAVYAWYRQGGDRATAARYTVHHAGGVSVVTVDQTRHGDTWHYLGHYGFRGGEEAQVVLTNQSPVAGQTVVAGDIRFGGGTFDDLTGISTVATAPPAVPWWEVCAYYYVQRMGMGPPPYGDVTARPIYARWEHAGTGEDAVYISWHTNGYNGYQWNYSGTTTYIHSGEGYTVTEGSAALRHTVHSEVIHDLRAGWDPAWQDLGERSRNLGELRLLWDDDPAARMPGALIEIAYHDHPTATDALKEPRFEQIVARAVYQGIVEYFAQRDGISLTLLPEPPTHLAVQNVGGGRVRLSWRPPLTDDGDLAGDPPTSYRIYRSDDGLGWDAGTPVSTTVYTLTGLTPGSLLFVKVTAVNAGGESFPTAVLGARVGEPSDLLIVNGFDRLDRMQTVPDDDPIEGYNLRLLLDRMNRRDYVIQHGDAIPYPFDSASNEAVRDGPVNLTDYALVDWFLGEESSADHTLDAVERSRLDEFLAQGGALLLSGTDVGWELAHLAVAPDFYSGTLRAAYVGDDAATYLVSPVSGTLFADLPPFRFDAPGMYDPDSPDIITPTGGAVSVLTYGGNPTATAAVGYVGAGCERLLYLAFPFETIWPEQRGPVMERALDFLGVCLAALETDITSPSDGAVYDALPPFRGTARATGDEHLARVEVQLERLSDGLYLAGDRWLTGTAWLTRSAWVTAATWATATGAEEWSLPLPRWLGEGAYRLRARARSLSGDVDPSPAAVVFTYAPPTGAEERVYLPLVLRDFAPARPTCADYLLNGDFEADGGWTFNRAVYTTTIVHGGDRSALAGLPPGSAGEAAYSSLAQTVALPSGTLATSATLALWLYPVGEGGDTDDYYYIGLRDAAGDYHSLAHWTGDTRRWERRGYDLTAYLGQTVTLYIGVWNDGDDDTAALYVDDVSLVACR